LEELGYKAKITIGYGAAAKAISKLVKMKDLDLLVMDTHGHKASVI